MEAEGHPPAPDLDISGNVGSRGGGRRGSPREADSVTLPSGEEVAIGPGSHPDDDGDDGMSMYAVEAVGPLPAQVRGPGGM